MARIASGLDRVLAEGLKLPGRGRVAVLCNATTVSSSWVPTADGLGRVHGIEVVRLLSPQHGFASEKQDNMVESPDAIHPRLKVPIVSLYSQTREPGPEALAGLDAVLIDLQDVGTRVYTFAVTALLTIRSAARAGVQIVVLDRPNPIGGEVEGPTLAPGYHSFVGLVDVPLRHGLTIGELCLYGAMRLGVLDGSVAARLPKRPLPKDLDLGPLRVVTLAGWRRAFHLDETGLPWTVPSPNLPRLDSAVVYPGQVALEGTNLSEGRGTSRPFEFFGAPYLTPEAVAAELVRRGAARLPGAGYAGALLGAGGTALDGVVLREIHYEPTFQKHAGRLVRGFHLHVTDRRRYRPVRAVVTLLAAIRRTHPEAFAWREPPYEYEWDRLAIDLIFGTDTVRTALDAGASPDEVAASWEADLRAFEERIQPFRLYGS